MIFSIKPFEIHDGDGIRTTVFFKGCPLRCKWCHNPESFSFKKEMLFDHAACRSCMRCVSLCSANVIRDGKHVFIRENCTLCGKCRDICPNHAFSLCGQALTADEIAEEVCKDELFMKGSGGGVTFSGGEPLAQVDFCIEIAERLKKHDLNIAIDTSGYVDRESIQKIIPYADMFLFDIKAMDEEVHMACTGVSNKRILENIRYVDSLGVPMEIRYPYVPGMNDGEAEKIAEFVKSLHHVKAVRVLPYHNYAAGKYESLDLCYPLPEIPQPTREEILAAVEIFQRSGIENAMAY